MSEVTVKIPDEMHDRLKETADLRDIPPEQAILHAIESWNEKPHSTEEFDREIEKSRFDS